MNQIKCIFFDLGWTLLEPCSGDWNLNQKFYELFPREKISRLDQNVWQHAYNTAYLPFIENPTMRSEQEQIERLTRFYLTLFDQAKLGGTFQHAVTLAVDAVENLATMNLIPSSLETLQSLKDAGYRIGIISDTWPYIERRIHAFKLDEYVDQYTYSYELGVLKPNLLMYRDALEKAGLKPEECIFIDNQVKNLEAAKSLGIHPVQIIYHEGIEIGEYPTIQKPSDILDLLKQYQ